MSQQIAKNPSSQLSRLVQPTSRLSFVPRMAGNSSQHASDSSSANINSTTSGRSSTSSNCSGQTNTTPSQTYVGSLSKQAPQMNSSYFHATPDQPNANTSGLPGPKSRFNVDNRLPSTVGSALRRRTLTPSKSSSRLPSANVSMNSTDVAQRTALSKQSERIYGTSNISGVSLTNNAGRDSPTIPLPSLKSSSYLNRALNKDQTSQETVKPGAHQNLGLFQNSTSKPSHLVKPSVGGALVYGLRSTLSSSLISSNTNQTTNSEISKSQETSSASQCKAVTNEASCNSQPSKTNTNTSENTCLNNQAIQQNGSAENVCITSNSHSNLSSASQELNSMIQMLSSSVILSQTDGTNNNLTDETESNNKNNSSTQLPKLKSKVSKSSSLNFGIPKMSSLINTSQNRLLDHPTDNSINIVVAQNNSISSSRPKSRIIYDPTNTQFHITTYGDSTTTLNQFNSSGSNSITSSGESSLNMDQDVEVNQFLSQLHCAEDQDEASLKLMDTQNKIISLKFLPSLGDTHTWKQQESDKESESIRLLEDCKGSLESLTRTNNLQKFRERDNLKSMSSRSSLDTPQRSSIGSSHSILRTHMVDYHKNPPGPKTATVLRHASLRSPEPPELHNPMLERKASLKLKHESDKHSSIGSDIFQRASKKLSVSSSSLTSKFKFMSGPMVRRPSTGSSSSTVTDGASSTTVKDQQATSKGFKLSSLRKSTTQQVSRTSLV